MSEGSSLFFLFARLLSPFSSPYLSFPQPLSQRFFSAQAPYTEPSFPLKNFVLAGVRKRGEKQKNDKNIEDGRKVSEYFIRRIASLAAVELSGLVVAKVLRQQPLNMWDLEVRRGGDGDYL